MMRMLSFLTRTATPDQAIDDTIDNLDLAFVVDTTGSMGGLIASAQRQMIAMIIALTRTAEVRMRLAVVEYRDHPPQDQMVYRIHPFTGDLMRAEATINGLSAAGGGDTPEAVLDGVLAACRELEWRPHARRIAVLVGDAPPHAHCACGETIESVSAAAEIARVTLYGLGLTNAVTESFGRLSGLTGGEFFAAGRGEEAMQRLQAILADEFGNLDFDRRVLAAYRAGPELSVKQLGEQLGCNRMAVSSAIGRLGKRLLI